MINFHKDILLKIWEYDDTIKNNFQKCINEIKEGMEFEIWGVVTNVIHSLR